MRLSKDFFYTLKEDVSDEDSVSGKLLVRSGMIKKISNGIYAKMPLGQKALSNIENIIRKNMDEAGANELKMPTLLPMDIFEKTGRKDAFGSSMFKLNDRYDREYALGPTHEELFVISAASKIRSYRDMPFTIYQIGTKYRDEIRPRLGLIRVREFTMKDAYSFDVDYEGLDISYNKMLKAYHKIFKELGIEYTVVQSDTGVMGGLLSEEFQALTDTGEDILVLCEHCGYSANIEIANLKGVKYDEVGKLISIDEDNVCPKCGKSLTLKRGIEVGNIFKLGTKYSESLGLNYLDNENQSHPVIMGCYGIGIERILSAVVEQNNDENGIIWPVSIAPYKVAIVVINPEDEKQINTANELYEKLNSMNIDTMIDDRKERPGVKFKDMDLIGTPIRITVGKKITDDVIEVKLRKTGIVEECKVEEAINKVQEILF